MIDVTVEWTFKIVTDDESELPSHAEQVMQELLELEKCSPVHSSSVALDVTRPEIEIGLSATGDDFQAAVAEAMSAIRSAIHAAGGSTPDWPNPMDLAIAYQPGELHAVP